MPCSRRGKWQRPIRRHVHGVPDELADLDAEGVPLNETGIDEIFRALRDAYAIDFSLYKPNTVARRIERRLQLNGAVDLEQYVARLRHDREELNSLYKDLLIGVTRFFRDEEAFHLLETKILPTLLDHVPAEEELRVWIAGCATGEEAYSVGILIHEALSDRKRPIHAKIFATDVHQASLETASAGVYRDEALAGVSPNRLARYFVKHAGGYQVNAELRKMIVFAPHNVVKDAPFTKLDLVCCRNLLIYFQPPAQKKAISLFHFALKTGGVMFLGPSETAGEIADEFETIDGHWKMFRKRRDVRLPTDLRLPLSHGLAAVAGRVEFARRWRWPRWTAGFAIAAGIRRAARAIRSAESAGERASRIGALVCRGGPISGDAGWPTVGRRARTGPQGLAIAAGRRVAAGGQRTPAGAIRSLATLDASRQRATEPVDCTGEHSNFRRHLLPDLVRAAGQEADRTPSRHGSLDFNDASREHLADVEDELRYTKENLQATIEELETTNEELQATNEELVASNEELQSTNEELHSVNEELYTVNAEYQRKITELTELTDDMDNLLRSTDIGTIFLDRSLRIRKFTPQIYDAFQVMPQDIGRSIETFSPSIKHDTLLADVQQVLESGVAFQKDVQDRHGHWFLLRISPYRSKGQIDGVVITLVDIAALKQTEAELKRMSKVFMDGADPIIIEDLGGRIVDLNREAAEAYGWSREELIGRERAICSCPKNISRRLAEFRERCRNMDHVRNVETMRQDKAGNIRPVLLTLSLLGNEEGKPIGIATLAKDISTQKDAEKAAREAVDPPR